MADEAVHISVQNGWQEAPPTSSYFGSLFSLKDALTRYFYIYIYKM